MVDMIRTTEFLPYILPHAPGVAKITAEFNARLAAIEFCARTRCWRQMIEVDLIANEPVLAAPDYAAIHDIEQATWGQRLTLTPVPFSDLPSGWAEHGEQQPRIITQRNTDQVIVYPFMPGRLSLAVFLKPRSGSDFTRSASPMDDYFNQVPDFLASNFAEAISHGALARILVMPQKPWTDPAAAGFFKTQFDMACNANSSRNILGQQRAPIRTKFQGM